MAEYGSTDSGASLGDILGAAISKAAQERKAAEAADDGTADDDEAAPAEEFVHRLQRGRQTYPDETEVEARRFLEDVRDLQERLKEQMAGDTLWERALEPSHRKPHARLMQVLDALSLALCSAIIAPAEGVARGLGEDYIVFEEVPRRSWEDRVRIALRPQGSGRIQVDPFPFDESPLAVSVPARLARAGDDWRSAPWKLRHYTLVP